MEIIERAHGGPLYTEKEFDMKVFIPKLRAIIKEYDIRFDPETVVPSDDAFADRLFEAGLEFYRQVGTYCVDTNRIIQFTADELREALATAPKAPIFGEGKDAEANTMVNQLLRRYEDKIADAPRGKRFQDLFNVSTLKPSAELREMYAKAKSDLTAMGLRFVY